MVSAGGFAGSKEEEIFSDDVECYLKQLNTIKKVPASAGTLSKKGNTPAINKKKKQMWSIFNSSIQHSAWIKFVLSSARTTSSAKVF